jgi:hypothetical protein
MNEEELAFFLGRTILTTLQLHSETTGTTVVDIHLNYSLFAILLP